MAAVTAETIGTGHGTVAGALTITGDHGGLVPLTSSALGPPRSARASTRTPGKASPRACATREPRHPPAGALSGDGAAPMTENRIPVAAGLSGLAARGAAVNAAALERGSRGEVRVARRAGQADEEN